MSYTILSFVIIMLLVIIFIVNYKRWDIDTTKESAFYLSPSVSNALKGLCSIIIICHHWCLFNHNILGSSYNIFLKLLPMLGGNFCLIIFFFLSGYGITISETKHSNRIFAYSKKRIWKIYKPACIIRFISILLYLFLIRNEVTLFAKNKYYLSPILYNISHKEISVKFLYEWFIQKMDWYVFTTIILYIIFYIVYHAIPSKIELSFKKKYRIFLMVISVSVYYVIAYYFFGFSEAHYYRNLWAFLLGVIIGIDPNLIKSKYIFIFVSVMMLFNFKQEGYIYIIPSVLALTVLMILGLTNKTYELNSKFFAYLGGISYYVYLSHSLFYNLLWEYNLLYFPLFLALTIGFATVYKSITALK